MSKNGEMQMNEKVMIQKKKELLDTGRMTLESLKLAQMKLDSVKSWITIDGFGGSFLISIVKHSKIEEMLEFLEKAKKDVRRFQLQLKTIEHPDTIKKDVGIFVSFATFFLDGTVETYLVKERVEDVTEQLRDAVEMVECICNSL